jgi:transcriptional regulator with XRE-family HTH domain
MKREELLRTREYWLTHIQNDLFNLIDTYRKKKKLNQTELGVELGVSKGYVSQMINGDFDHKISKLVDLSLAFNKAPIISFMDLDKYIQNDAEDKPNYLDNMHERTIEYVININLGAKKNVVPAFVDYNNNSLKKNMFTVDAHN